MKLTIYVLSALLIASCVKAGDYSDRQDLDISDLEKDSEIRKALKHGINWIYWKAAEKYDISDLNIEVTQVNKIQKWEANGDNYYYFDVEAENDDAYVNSTYNVRRLSDGAFKVVNDWSYNIDRKHANEEEPNNYDDNHDNNDDNELPDPDTNVEIEVEGFEIEPNQCQEGVAVDSSEINNDSQLRAALEHGLAWIFQKAQEKFEISNAVITVKKVESICSWEKDGSTYYHFDLEAGNEDDDVVDCSYNVKCEAGSGDLRVVNEWRYNIDFHKGKPQESDSYNNDNEDQNTDTYQDSYEEQFEAEVEIDIIYNDNDDNNNNNYDDSNDNNNNTYDGGNDENNDDQNDDDDNNNNYDDSNGDDNDDDNNNNYDGSNDDNNSNYDDGNDENNDDQNDDNDNNNNYDDSNDGNNDDNNNNYDDGNDQNNDDNNNYDDHNDDDNNNNYDDNNDDDNNNNYDDGNGNDDNNDDDANNNYLDNNADDNDDNNNNYLGNNDSGN